MRFGRRPAAGVVAEQQASAAARRRARGRTGTAGPRPRRPGRSRSARTSSASRATCSMASTKIGVRRPPLRHGGLEYVQRRLADLAATAGCDQAQPWARVVRRARPGAWSAPARGSAACATERRSVGEAGQCGRRPDPPVTSSNFLTTCGQRLAAGGTQVRAWRRVSTTAVDGAIASSSSRKRSTVADCAGGSATWLRTNSLCATDGFGPRGRPQLADELLAQQTEPAGHPGP